MFLGVALLGLASLFLLYEQLAIFTFPMGAMILVLGLLISPHTGVSDTSDKAHPARILVDRAVLGASIYLLAFFDSRLVLKRLVSSKTTILSVVILALLGYSLDRLVGVLAGGAGGYALQEYSTQRNRLRILRDQQIGVLARGDLEFPYEGLKEVRLLKSRLLIVGNGGTVRISLPRGYGSMMSSKLGEILHGKYVGSDSVGSSEASGEQGK